MESRLWSCQMESQINATTDNLRVLIVANDPLVREGLAALFFAQPGFALVGQIAADRNLTAQLALYDPNVVLWDFGLNPELSIKFLLELPNLGPPIVALLPDESHATEAWTENIRGLLLREVEAENLRAALRAAAQELVALDPALAAVLVPHRHPEKNSRVEALTPRELEVLQLLAEGLSNKTIAQRLYVSEHTVKFHVNAILGKLNASSRTDAVVRATRLGLIIL